MNDEELGTLLRGAMRPADAYARREVWPEIVERLDRTPGVSIVDFGLAAAIVGALLLNPEWLLVLTYHL